MDPTRRVSSPESTQIVGAEPTSIGPLPAPLSLQCLPESSAVLATGGVTHLLAEFRASGTSTGRRLPLCLALIIDRSGSMEGEPLAYVKQAANQLVDLLGPEDLLTIITFEDTVEVVMPLRRVVNKELIKQHIARIIAGRTTNLYDALVSAGQQLATAPAQQYVFRALLLTDGEPTAGIKDFSSIVNLVGDLKARGVTVSALGFGPEYNEELLAGVARRGGGNYYYITRPELIPEVFRRELQVLANVVAQNLKLRIRVPRWVRVRQIYGHQPQFGERYAEISLPDLELGASLAVVAELQFDPHPEGPFRIAVVEGIFDDATTGERGKSLRAEGVVEFTRDPQRVSTSVNPLVQAQVELAQASRQLERTMMGMRTQQISPMTAVLELEKTRALLIAQGRMEEAQEVTQAIESLRQGQVNVAEKTLIGTVYDLDIGKNR